MFNLLNMNQKRNRSVNWDEEEKDSKEIRNITKNASLDEITGDNIIEETKQAPKRKLNVECVPENETKARRDYVKKLIIHSKKLKEDEHRRRMDMAQEEHLIKMEIYKQELATKNEQMKCAILEREILELKKIHEEKNNS